MCDTYPNTKKFLYVGVQIVPNTRHGPRERDTTNQQDEHEHIGRGGCHVHDLKTDVFRIMLCL